MAQTICNGDATTLSVPQNLSDLAGIVTAAQLPSGVPVAPVAPVVLLTQSAAKTTTLLFTPSVNGLYRISVNLKLTATGTSPVVGPVTITYTDADDSTAQSKVMSFSATTGAMVTTTVNNSVTTSNIDGNMVINAKAGSAVNYAIAESGTIAAGRWAAHIKVEAL